MRRARLKSAIVITSAVLSFGVMCLWSYTSTVDNLLLSVLEDAALSVNVRDGRMEWRRVAVRSERLPRTPDTAYPRAGIPQPRTRFGFAFTSGSAYWFRNHPGDLRQVDYWQLAIPLWLLLAIVSAPWIVWLWRWYRRTRQARVGFEVAPPE
jgi:hypothetical protein